MGDLISLTERITVRNRLLGDQAAFFFALDCPLSYVAAEQIERELGEIAWVPVLGDLLAVNRRPASARERLNSSQMEAHSRRLPLVEPDGFPSNPLAITRAAVHASTRGRGRMFGLAALRMAFCGGYDLADPEVIGAAADAAGLDADAVLAAASSPELDASIGATAAGLRRQMVDSAPVIRVGTDWFHGFDTLNGAELARAREIDPAALAQPLATILPVA
jgi:2-hydroxychromene-2-carboxylate isomerase